ncbi:MAG: 4'-phosphopantetheinyl transferase family protein [Chthoniobacterales bacterium]
MHRSLEELAESPVSGARVWLAELTRLTSAELRELQAALAPGEAARADRFHFEKDRQRFIAARGLLRFLLGEELGQNPAELVFAQGEHGKPRLVNADETMPALDFNVSHSAGWAMIALAYGRRVGIDLEAGERLEPDDGNLSALAARIMSAGELEFWRALPDAPARRAGFLRAWTRKEAYSKAIGKGFSADFAQVEIALDATDSCLFTGRGGLTSRWLIRDLAAPLNFHAALAIEQRVAE